LHVQTVYLNDTLSEELCIEQPEGFCGPEFPDHVWKLKKSRYGLKQSPSCWYANLREILREYGFTCSVYMMGAFICANLVLHNFFVTIYVDDIVIASNGDRTVAALKEILKKKYRITDAGRLENFLGLKINR
ncbi:unnamed protein product, partial [Heterosigma akashiwo]